MLARSLTDVAVLKQAFEIPEVQKYQGNKCIHLKACFNHRAATMSYNDPQK